MNVNKKLDAFVKKILEIFTLLDIQIGKDEILKNLMSTFFVNFSRLMASNETISPFLKDFSQTDDPDPNKVFDYLDSKNINYQEVLISAQNETLQSFVSELESKLPPEKIRELQKIITE